MFCWEFTLQINRIRYVAYRAVNAAIRNGFLPALDSQYCVDCGRFATRYDHRNYGQPLAVEPLCNGCNIRRGPAEDIIGLRRAIPGATAAA